MSRELKACPFCGGDATYYRKHGGWRARDSVFYWVECETCGAKTKMTSIDEDECSDDKEWNNIATRRVASLWNRREDHDGQ